MSEPIKYLNPNDHLKSKMAIAQSQLVEQRQMWIQSLTGIVRS